MRSVPFFKHDFGFSPFLFNKGFKRRSPISPKRYKMQFEFMRPRSSMSSTIILSQHVDTLHVTFKSTDNEAFARYNVNHYNSMEYYKDKAQEVEGFDLKSRFFEYEPFGAEFGSFRIGPQGNGQYRYIMQNDDLMMFFGNAKFDSDAPHIKVEFRAHYLFAIGHKKAFAFVEKLVNKVLGAHIARVQRIDLATDVMGASFDILDRVRFQNMFASSTFAVGSKSTGISFGSGAFVFRMYDKLAQIRNKYSLHFVKKKWVLNGWDEEKNKVGVVRFEVQYRTDELKKYTVPKIGNVDAIFNAIPSLWAKALQKIKYAPLTNDEAIKISTTNITQSTKRDIYKKARDDKSRFQFGDFLKKLDASLSDLPMEYFDIKEANKKTAMKQFLGFLSATYKSSGGNPLDLSDLVSETAINIQLNKGITLHEYGLAKVMDSYVKRQKQIEKYGLVPKIDYSQSEFKAIEFFKSNLTKLDKYLEVMSANQNDLNRFVFKDEEVLDNVA